MADSQEQPTRAPGEELAALEAERHFEIVETEQRIVAMRAADPSYEPPLRAPEELAAIEERRARIEALRAEIERRQYKAHDQAAWDSEARATGGAQGTPDPWLIRQVHAILDRLGL